MTGGLTALDVTQQSALASQCSPWDLAGLYIWCRHYMRKRAYRAVTTAQSIVLDARPAPQLSRREIVSMPYCDNTHAVSLDPDTAENGKKALAKTLEDCGFTLDEEMSATS